MESDTTQKSIKVLHVMTGFSPKFGGVYQCVSNLTNALKKHVDVSLISAYMSGHFDTGTPVPGIRHFHVKTWGKYQFSLEIKKHLEELIPKYDLVHVHALWQFPLSYAAYIARKRKIPYVYNIHGMLGTFARRHHSYRKRIYAALWERKNLNSAKQVICITTTEQKEAESFGIIAPISVIPNGIDRSWASILPSKDKFRTKYLHLRGKFLILFLGRIHPIKSIDLLIKAFHKLFQANTPAHLIIAGPEQDLKYANHLKKSVQDLGLQNQVTFLGPVFGDEKKELLAASDLFVLPSRSEGFSIAVLEAMACQVPVITTESCNFPEIEKFKAGFVIPHDLEKLVSSMSQIVADEKLQTQMGINARKLVLTDYNWDVISLRLFQIYKQILDKG